MLDNQPPVSLHSLSYVGSKLSRPECVLATPSNGIFASHMGAGIVHINADGSQRLFGKHTFVDGHMWIPNGFAQTENGFQIANMGEQGGVWQLDIGGHLRPILLEIDGKKLGPTNFVLQMPQGGMYISVSTNRWPLIEALNHTSGRQIADGYICLVDRAGARVVADNLCFANEIRQSPDGRYIYACETMAARIIRFPVLKNGDLGKAEVVIQFSSEIFPDGLAFDTDGCIWCVSVISNKLLRIGKNGEFKTIIEDSDQEYIAGAVRNISAGTMTRDYIEKNPSTILKNISSISFGGADMKSVYIGSLSCAHLIKFRSSVAGI